MMKLYRNLKKYKENQTKERKTYLGQNGPECLP